MGRTGCGWWRGSLMSEMGSKIPMTERSRSCIMHLSLYKHI